MTRIVLLPGDGIGPEVTEQARLCLAYLSERRELNLSFETHDFGGAAIDRHGEPLPEATLAACRAADGILLGHVSLRWVDATAGQGEIRFVFNPAYRSKGYATEAVRRMVDLAFEHFRIHRIFARCDARNTRSAKLMTRLGMRLEAHYREHALFQGEWDEELHFAILDREWQRSNKVHELHHKVA